MGATEGDRRSGHATCILCTMMSSSVIVCVSGLVSSTGQSHPGSTADLGCEVKIFFLMIRTFYYYRLATDDNRRLEIIVPSEVYAASMYLSIKKKKMKLVTPWFVGLGKEK